MPLLGSDGGFQADNRGGLIDELGNTVVSSSTNFAASPLGVAARTQALYGIPNATFNLTPPDPAEPIVANQNDLPYWGIENLSDGQITATTIFDATTQTWGVELNPGTAASGSTLSLATRSYLITDDNLALRQKALAVLAKSGTAAVSTQWNLSLNAIYYDANDTALSTAIIGTVYDTGTWTSLAGTTTPGGSAINAAAQYVDLTFTMTTTAAVTGSAKATIKSLLLSTSSATSGSFVIAETFTANSTWTRPVGVDYLLAVVAAGGGGGGGGGGLFLNAGNDGSAQGGNGGAGGNYYIARDFPLGTALSFSIGIGAGGGGGAGTATTKASGSGGGNRSAGGAAGAAGGATTFGSIFTVNGGGAGAGTSVSGTQNLAQPGTSATTSVYGGSNAIGGRGGGFITGGSSVPLAGDLAGFTIVPYTPTIVAANTAGTPTVTGGVTASGAGGTSTAGFGGGAGAGGTARAQAAPVGGAGMAGISAGGGGGGGLAVYVSTLGTVTGTAGNGANGAANISGGGGGGGAVAASGGINWQNTVVTIESGAGGTGSSGFVTVVYVA
jgi:hypothetical protein